MTQRSVVSIASFIFCLFVRPCASAFVLCGCGGKYQGCCSSFCNGHATSAMCYSVLYNTSFYTQTPCTRACMHAGMHARRPVFHVWKHELCLMYMAGHHSAAPCSRPPSSLCLLTVHTSLHSLSPPSFCLRLLPAPPLPISPLL